MSAGGSPAQPPNPRALIVGEWIAKAEADLDLARREHSFAGNRNLDAVGFHAQQAAEKLMKAVLIDRGITPPKIHDLDALDQLLGTIGIGPVASTPDLTLLTMAAVRARYPGRSLTAQEAADALRVANSIWTTLRPLI